ncbi:hypothetical protein DUI87_21411 [Hirundo rustica rustica]|uniref:Uncharacterized protein n=1 Tax=Hirundo rustica rustica TaxID=333673 RepID=A0A3M0JT08_HIRRU|nr:hypothetical protein DUI87_21411 [Hirundo rustica rustica]
MGGFSQTSWVVTSWRSGSMKELLDFKLQSRNFAKISLCLQSLDRGQPWSPAASWLRRPPGTDWDDSRSGR